MENSIKMDDLGVPLFLETPTSYESFFVVDSVDAILISTRFFFICSIARYKIHQIFHCPFVCCLWRNLISSGDVQKKDIGKRGNFAPSPANLRNPQEGWN